MRHPIPPRGSARLVRRRMQDCPFRARVLLESAAPHTAIAFAGAGYGVAVVLSTVVIPRDRVRAAVPIVQRGAALAKWLRVAWEPQRSLALHAQRFIEELVADCERHYPGREFIRHLPTEAEVISTRGFSERSKSCPATRSRSQLETRNGASSLPVPLIPDIAVFQSKLAGFPLATYQAGAAPSDVRRRKSSCLLLNVRKLTVSASGCVSKFYDTRFLIDG